MRKIYCCNCKWFDGSTCDMRRSSLFFNVSTITHKGEKVYQSRNVELLLALHGGNEYEGSEKCIANLGFNCPVYERKWYKFWIFPLRNPKSKELLLEKVL